MPASLLAAALALGGCDEAAEHAGHAGARRPAAPAVVVGHPVIHEPGWGEPVRLPFNDDGWEDSPYLTRDGGRILFFYHPWPDLITAGERLTEYVVAHPHEAEAQGLDGKIMVSPRPFTSRNVHPISADGSPALECCPYLAPNGELWYASNRRSWDLGRGVPTGIYRNGAWIDLGTGGEESNPHYCAARDELWFDCPGDANLCVMREARAAGFHGVVTLAPYPVNARDVDRVQDSQAFLTDDCDTLYITSSRGHREDDRLAIYRLRRLDAAGHHWSEPEPFITSETPVAELSMTADGRALAFAQVFRRADGTPGVDIWYAEREGPR